MIDKVVSMIDLIGRIDGLSALQRRQEDWKDWNRRHSLDGKRMRMRVERTVICRIDEYG